MRFLVRWTFRLVILAAVLAVALILSKDALLKSLAETQIRAQTGMDVRIGKLELGLFSPTLNVEDFKLYNPAEFGGSPLLDVPDLHVEYNPAALTRLRLQLRLVRIAVSEINIVEARDGRTNLVLSLDDLESAPRRGGVNAASIFGFAFSGVETLNLTLGKARYTSLRRPGKATEVQLGLKNEIMTDVQSIAQLKQQLMRTLFRNGITITDAPPQIQRRAR